jgi:hypothetical protein
MRAALAAALLAGGMGGALAGCQFHTEPITTSLRMSGSPPDARVTVDDQHLGALAFVQQRGVALPPGRHRITVEKAGYFPWDRVVVAEEGMEPIRLAVTLEKIPD